MTVRLIVPIAVILSALAFPAEAKADENWPQWRGPEQNGVGNASGLPETWSDTENIVWKTPLPCWSGGSPAIWGDRIFVTSPSKGEEKKPEPKQEGRRRGRRGESSRDPGGSELLLLCIAKEDGAILWERQLDDGNKLRRKQNDSSPSPVTDGKNVWAGTGTGAVACFDMDGTPVWQLDLEEQYGDFGLMFGYANSPILYDGKLIIEVVHGWKTDKPSYLVAFDALSGKEQWRVERRTDAKEESQDAYTTPTLLRHGGKTEIVVSGANWVTGHNPEDGAELWRAGGLNPKMVQNFRIIASPVAADGMVYAPSRKKPLLALRAGGTGDVTKSHLVWNYTSSMGPDVPTPACDGKYLYIVEDRGSVACLDAKTGEVLWGPERTARGTVSASPVIADGKVYVINEEAVTSVLAAGPKYKEIATNQLAGGYTLSTPAISGSRIYLRTETHLYCIGADAG